MAFWLRALKLIPWSAVIAAAPTVATGARELWDARRDSRRTNATARPLEEQVAELRKELEVASELLGQLAEQNQRLASALPVLEARVRRLAAAAVVMGAGLIALAVTLALR